MLSPSQQRGRDFGIILRCLWDQGYSAEWRIINAADYGFPQRRRRTFILAYRNDTQYAKEINDRQPLDILKKSGIFARCFPAASVGAIHEIDLTGDYQDLVAVSERFQARFLAGGVMKNGRIYTADIVPKLEPPTPLKDIVQHDVDPSFFLTEAQAEKFEYLRLKKKILRTAKNGLQYSYCEGSMAPFDSLDLPGRTMLTSEGTVNRSTHIIQDPDTGKLRFLTPVECERLNGFPDGWTDTGMPLKMRYFTMGNALVCGIVDRLGGRIAQIMRREK